MLENWQKVSFLLCVFGFLREMRPSEPFAVEFFINYRNITNDELTNYYFPLGTYSYMIQLVVIFLITDIMRYKPIIVFSAFIGMLLFGLMSWTTSKEAILFVQMAFGTFMACEIAYYTYIYAKVERSKYQLVTGHTRSAILAGRFVGAAFAQLIVSFGLMNYKELNYISFGSQCFSLIIALLLPSVSVSLYFYSNSNGNENGNENESGNCHVNHAHSNGSMDEMHVRKVSATNDCDLSNIEKSNSKQNVGEHGMPTFSLSHAIQRIGNHIKTSYSNVTVIQWSILWSMSMCGFLQVQSYIQPLWKEIDPHETVLYNGAVEALITLLGAISAYAAGFLNSKSFNRYEIWILTILMLVEGGLLLWGSLTTSLWCCYISYVIFGMIYHFMITVASASVAKKLHEECFALIFGINTLCALILQSFLTFVVITKYNLLLRTQYQLYSYLFFVLALIYSVIGVAKMFVQRRKLYEVKG
ncbi:folate-like transporter 2 [Contarinia nasturtii]|uniref:folate-like transporter 2 n=1 Tax=Contarinia nasturtii TaxID=265458 RepID=UPI0012D3F3ED|nr:folate-like transporter 2 [Contarinia nasturtii]XP_031633912.1 folate-like transporter 2 [Contarinia nasturtii]XP_031633919.1 folate-like transporter 2 [Contarinia nasturtii]XP_031633927.1 folate-like transporter 2 [Contarinia nasturtii]XP_031633936.1 folate-like transporter 2 [Contarinia nasturtii]XP_031633943.1 folate-like transporter 2 [Contarinia nasturtii]XP_031633950.1 folate-like transporter 2 [Contarinia nasturtii]XP_031633958.1 folate-like transporter 2 [Contarinia nasturtii]